MRSRNSALLVMLLSFHGATAQDVAAPRIYTPKTLPQNAPMRVEVLGGTNFRDIETGGLFRLYGVDACAPDQTAAFARQTWPCGIVATAWLVNATLNKWVTCTPIRVDGLLNVGRCATGELVDVAQEMLKQGLAITSPDPQEQLISTYKQTEAEARRAYRGLWGSQFQMPWDFRNSQKAGANE